MSVMQPPLAITGLGLITPVGHDSLESFASFSSEITAFGQVRIPSKEGRPLAGASIAGVAEEFVHERRLDELARNACVQALRQAGLAEAGESRILFLLVAPLKDRPGYRWPAGDVDSWLMSLPCASARISYRVLDLGHPGALCALAEAQNSLASGDQDVCVVVAADSLLQLRTLRWLESDYRLKTELNPDGLLPGEAAAAMVLESPARAAGRGTASLCTLRGVGVSHEPATIVSDTPCAARGLSHALTSALVGAEVDSADISAAYCDMNGEFFRAQEWTLAEIRALSNRHADFRLLHPADSIGDVGAATGAVLACLAAAELSCPGAEPATTLVFSSGEGHERAAAIFASEETVTAATMRDPAIAAEVPAVFNRRLYEEHIDDIGGLYMQRRYILRHAENGWRRARVWEQRLLRHVHAVRLGGASAAAAVRRFLAHEDEGDVFAATISLLDSGYGSLVGDGLTTLKPAAIRGFQDALKYTQADISFLLPGARAAGEMVHAAAIDAFAYRRELALDQLIPLLQEESEAVVCAAARALARLHDLNAAPKLRMVLVKEDGAIRMDVAWALLRLGATDVLEACRALAGRGVPGASLAIGLSGEAGDWRRLKDAGDMESVEALGWLGAGGSIPALISLLETADPKKKPIAAAALNRITGADLFDELEVRDEDDDVEFRRTASVLPERWQEWWCRFGPRFAADLRYRRGAPFSFGACVDELESDAATEDERYRAYLELAMRSGQAIPFEADWFHARQVESLERWRTWALAACCSRKVLPQLE